MQIDKIKAETLKAKYSAFKITVTYIALGIFWILTSDKLLDTLVKDRNTFYQISIYKGWFYILITALLLYSLIQNSVKNHIDLSTRLIENINELRRAEMLLNHKINELVTTESRLSLTEERYRMVLESIKSGVWDYDIDDETVFFSPRYYKLTKREPIQERYPFADFVKQIHEDDQKHFLDALSDYLDQRTEGFSLDFRLSDVDGNYIWITTAGKAVWDGETPLRMIGSLTDITKTKADQDKIIELAYFDAITGLPNKAKLEEFTNTWLSKMTHPLAIIYLDIDNFKMINDALGHKLGDTFLVQIANRLRTLNPYIQMLSRIGGDEFCFVVTQFDNRFQLQLIAEKILELIRTPWFSNEREFHITGSIGIAIAPEHGLNLDNLLKKADTAMYASKNAGRNQWTFFHEELQDIVMEYVYLQSNMRRALDNHEFVIYYQPQVDMTSQKLKGAEALVRWQNPEIGLIPPDRFIGISEKTGFIKHLGLWIIEDVFKQHVQWADSFEQPLDISINLSAVQLMSPDFIDNVLALSHTYSVDPTKIIFEITETIAIDGSQTPIDTLEQLRSHGFRIALDDFGINYSSLSYIKRLPIDIIKLDKTFVAQLDKNPTDLAISRSVITLAHEMSLSVVAEGIERIVQYEILKELYCDFGQGYLFSRPLDVTEFHTLYKKQTKTP